MSVSLPKTQEGQLRLLKKETGLSWVLASQAYIDYCAGKGNKSVMIIAMPVGDSGHMSYYTPKNRYCTYSMEIVSTVERLVKKFDQQFLPTIKYDLNALPALALTKADMLRPLVATFRLDSDLLLSPIGGKLPITVGHNLHALQLNAQQALAKKFIQTLKLKVVGDEYGTEKVGLGYAVADKEHSIWNTSITVFPNLDFTAATNPQPIATHLDTWRIEGQLGFKVDGHWLDGPNDPQVAFELSSEAESERSWRELMVYVSAGVTIVFLVSPLAWAARGVYFAGGMLLATQG